ncbi:MAG: hypothetical protein ACRC9Q_01990 [Bacteroidales bacterium]
MSNNNASLLAFLLGLGLGAAVIYFIKSEKGENARKKVSDFLESKGIHLSADELNEFIGQMKNKYLKKDCNCEQPDCDCPESPDKALEAK